MEILLIEDNASIANALSETLTQAKFSVIVSEKADRAVQMALSGKYRYVILDYSFNRGHGQDILDRMVSLWNKRTEVKIILMKDSGPLGSLFNENKNKTVQDVGIISNDAEYISGSFPAENVGAPSVQENMNNEQAPLKIPNDNNFVIKELVKPFTTDDLLEAVSATRSDQSEKEKKPRSGLFGRKKDAVPVIRSDYNLELGGSYVIFSDTMDCVEQVTKCFSSTDIGILLITPLREKTAHERYVSNLQTIRLDLRTFLEFESPYPLGTFYNQIVNYINDDSHPYPIIVFDSLNILIDRNGMNATLVLICEICKYIKSISKKATLIVSVDDSDFTEKDRGILKSNLSIIDPVSKADNDQ